MKKLEMESSAQYEGGIDYWTGTGAVCASSVFLLAAALTVTTGVGGLWFAGIGTSVICTNLVAKAPSTI